MNSLTQSNRNVLLTIGVVLVVGAFIWYKMNHDRGDENLSDAIDLDVGLTEAESHLHRTLSQRNSVIPAGLLHAMEYEKGISMKDRLLTHGFLRGGGHRDLPIGFGLDKEEHLGLDFSKVSLNCAACHTGELHYENEKFRIDGAPNMVDIEVWAVELADTVEKILSSERELISTAKRFFEYSIKWSFRDAEENLGAESLKTKKDLLLLILCLSKLEVSVEEIRSSLEEEQTFSYSGYENENAEEAALQRYAYKNLIEKSDVDKEGLDGVEAPLLGERSLRTSKWINKLIGELRRLQREAKKATGIVSMVRRSPRVGPGRDDAWNLIDKVILNETDGLLDTPVSIPHLFGVRHYKVYHCDGNTNSMMDRNIAQAIALGADVDPDTDVASLSPKMVHKANTLARAIEAPKWPIVFGEIDDDLKKRGEEIFYAKNYDEYNSFDFRGQPLEKKSVSCADCHKNPESKEEMIYYQVGTDQKRLGHYSLHGDLLQRVVTNLGEIKDKTMRAHDVSPETIASWEQNGTPEWKNNKGYVARPLAGVWASAPYLHNGSVRTIKQLLLSVSQREKSFQSGAREFDTASLGFESKGDFTLNITGVGSNNVGHEFGAELSPQDREALIEYIKSL